MTAQDQATRTEIDKQTPDLRRQGALVALLSAAGTCVAAGLWISRGLLYGVLALAATFVLLVIVLIAGAASASRTKRQQPAEQNRQG